MFAESSKNHVNQDVNLGSQFQVLAASSDLRLDKEDKTKAVTTEFTIPEGSNDEEFWEEVVMETLEEAEVGANRVNVSVSHEGLADKLCPLGSTRASIRMQVQGESGGPTKRTDKVLKDMTNKLEVKPMFAKAFRPISKSNRAQQI